MFDPYMKDMLPYSEWLDYCEREQIQRELDAENGTLPEREEYGDDWDDEV